jgi:hypothetical protein
LIDTSTFNALEAQRRAFVYDLGWDQTNLAKEVTAREHINKSLAYLGDASFVYEHMDGSAVYEDQDVVSDYETAFRRADLQLRTFNGVPTADDLAVTVTVTRAGGVQTVQCDFSPTGHDAYKIVVHGPGGFGSVVDDDYFALSKGMTAGNMPDDFYRILGWPAAGAWSFELTGDGPIPVVTKASCQVIVQ